jgi:hypothetical protein
MLTIGEFSKTCSVSIKTLRYYDSVDLLKPYYVDKFTGYRYYDETQIDTMLLINRLKRYNFSLIEIKSFLNTNDNEVLLSKLMEQEEKIRTDIAHKQMILNEFQGYIRSFERTGVIMNCYDNYEIIVKECEEMPVLSCRQNMSVEEFGKYYSRLFVEIAKEKLTFTGKALAIYHDEKFDENNSNIEIAVSIKERDKATKIINKSLCVTTIHKGPYSNLTEGYGALVKWIKENGYEIVAPPFEIYVKSHVDGVPVEEWETEIFFPIK